MILKVICYVIAWLGPRGEETFQIFTY